jgi:hypothetical protein
MERLRDRVSGPYWGPDRATYEDELAYFRDRTARPPEQPKRDRPVPSVRD